MRLKSASSFRTTPIRRCGPIATFSGVSGAGFSPAHTISLTPSTASRALPTARSGWVAADAARPTTSVAVFTRPRRPAATRSVVDGSGAGSHSVPGASTSCGTGERSNSTVSRSTPAIPSIRAWWVLEIIAKRFFSRPSTNQVSHSGLERSRRWEKIRAASSRSCSSLPGSGSALWRTWYSRLKLGSSAHTGRPVSSGGTASRWR